MIIRSQAPTRISIAGGGSDIPEYSDKYGGMCISLAINLRQHIEMITGDEAFEGYSFFPPFGDQNFMYTFLKAYPKTSGMHNTRLHSTCDAYIGNGLGTSASAAVAMVGALNKRLNLNLSLYEIAEKAWEIESTIHYTGKQDHYASTFGGMNVFNFGNEVRVIPIEKSTIDILLPYLVLFYTGIKRKPKIQEGLMELTKEQIRRLDDIKALVQGALVCLHAGNIEGLGQVLDISWKLKKESNPSMVNMEVDALYDRVKACDALGAKILGSGGGGYMLALVEPEKRQQFIKDMHIEPEDISVDYNGLDCRIL